TTTDASSSIFTPTAADQLQFEFLPTAQVPSGHLPGGADPNLTSYALVITRNGSWVTTRLSAVGFSSKRALGGKLNQEFTAFSWNPAYAGLADGPVVQHMPMPDDGVLAVDGGSWQQTTGETWPLTG